MIQAIVQINKDMILRILYNSTVEVEFGINVKSGILLYMEEGAVLSHSPVLEKSRR
jgi:hypothetical protein